MYWHSTLVPSDPLFVPEVSCVQAFFDAVVELGAFTGAFEYMLLDYDHPKGSFEGSDPRTGAAFTVPTPSRVELTSTAQIAAKLAGLAHYLVELGSESQGSKPAWAGGIQPGWLAISRQAFGQVVSTSDLHDESDPTGSTTTPYGEPCTASQRLGRYTHPHTEKTLEVPGAGCASFVIDFASGNHVFPPESMTSLSLIAADYIAAARRCFGIDFVCACHWG